MTTDPFYQVPDPEVIQGHPTMELLVGPERTPTLLTVCAECGSLRTILFLSHDRWLCTKCRTSGATAPNLYPIS